MYTQREMIRVAKLYYEKGLTQQEIAALENISRPTVSRILDAALQEGIVTFSIQYPIESVDDLEDELKKRFDLMKVIVAPVIIPEPSFILTDVGKLLGDYLHDLVADGDTIGISWGNSLTYAAKQLKQLKRKNVRVVQLNGGVATTAFSTGAMNILDQFAKAFDAQPYALSVPTILDSAEIASALLRDSGIREIVSLGREANIAVFGIGRTSYQSVLNLAGYFKQDEYDKLLQKGAVGDICSRFYSIDGNVSDEQLNDRTIGLHLDDLRRKKHTIAIACGEDKVPAILGAVRGNYFNTLFTDEVTARELIKQHDIAKTAEVQQK
ncbi:sugar-binding transcriptional regulator [Brevibacillus fluminis]|uniref:Sugar-binding transcriptional regulator n=1 Tax=Brevibacillus fluminis TaxID=511487 RepID=A0A3M8DP08_9BACL|nr:sugar-binding transcriptional regulator [Brevibacillus fluminis]RNB89852.1 sugar-binding transcriptional regulator [Brevibacillus fluminis]